MITTKQRGDWGEQVAVDMLVAAGYAIMHRNWRMGHYEVDIIAQNQKRIVFVEVKTRNNGQDPIEAVDQRKRRRIVASANVFIKRYAIDLEPQFDIIGITGTPENYSTEHVPDAFFPTLKRH